jgi:hypothetical protein
MTTAALTLLRKGELLAAPLRAGRALQLVAKAALRPLLVARQVRRAEQLPLRAQLLLRVAPLPPVAPWRKQVPATARLVLVVLLLAVLVVDRAERLLAMLVADRAERSLAMLVADKAERSLAMLVADKVEPPRVVASPSQVLLEHLRQYPIVQVVPTMATAATVATSDTSVEPQVAILPIASFAPARSGCPRVLRAAQTSSSAGIASQSILAPRVLQEAANHALNWYQRGTTPYAPIQLLKAMKQRAPYLERAVWSRDSTLCPCSVRNRIAVPMMAS